MSSSEQLRLGHGTREDARERVGNIMQCLRHLAHYLDGDQASQQPMEYWYVRTVRMVGNLSQVLYEEETWLDGGQ